MSFWFEVYTFIQRLYEELFRQCSLNSTFEYNILPNDKVTLRNFIKWLKTRYRKEQVTVNFLVRYFEFQFSRYSGVYAKGHGKNKIQMNWLIGKKAIEAWQNRELSKKWLVKFKLNQEVHLKLKKTFRNEAREKRLQETIKKFIELSFVEEQAKKRFHNTELGFVYCDTMTTLYNPNSKLCIDCNFSSGCRVNLSQQYPILAKFRNNI